MMVSSTDTPTRARRENPIPPWNRFLVSKSDAAAMLGLSEQQFMRRVSEGGLPAALRLGERAHPRWNVDALRPFAGGHVPCPIERRPKSVPLGPGVTHLYRHFNAAGELLYVGISLSAIARLAEHRSASHWFWTIARIDVAAYASRTSAEKAERITIQREKPLHNIVHARP